MRDQSGLLFCEAKAGLAEYSSPKFLHKSLLLLLLLIKISAEICPPSPTFHHLLLLRSTTIYFSSPLQQSPPPPPQPPPPTTKMLGFPGRNIKITQRKNTRNPYKRIHAFRLNRLGFRYIPLMLECKTLVAI
ncbi:hypothetical protein ACH5RR_015415 [Cinchona calisaya]|uniref:Uncharacterized protein n=1 Tax=Cinchona calisaya TaxID=153742 RepID=A0ABD2ZUX6_9GENT